jgi:hypothetical protein
MLGEKVQETIAKVTGTRVLPAEGGGVTIETSYAGTGRTLGVETTEIGTYEAAMRPTGELAGAGQGMAMSKDGDVLTWKAQGVGKPTGKGLAASFRYSIVVQTTSPKWARLNSVLVVGEWEVDEQGGIKGQGWEWR